MDDLEQAEQTSKMQVRIQMMRLVAVTMAHKSRWLPAEKDGRQGAVEVLRIALRSSVLQDLASREHPV